MAATWDASAIAGLLASAFAPPVPTIDVLVTFDGRGVSGHPNHISLYHGARRFVASLPPLLPPPAETSPVELYVLRSVGVARKYAGAADALVTTLLRWGAAGVEELVFVSGWAAVRTGWRAMTQAHRSQMVWFRWGWIALSRYMYVNDLRLDVVAPERGPGWAREEGKEAM